MTTTAPVDAPRPSGATTAPGGGPEPVSQRPTRADAGASGDARDRIRRLALLVLPGTWIVIVLILALTVGTHVQVTPLLAAAPAIACTGTGRRQCVILSAACALFALVPIAGAPAALGQRAGTSLSILAVAATSFLIAQRRLRLQRDYEHVHRIADVTQRVLLRPVPERLGPVAAAVGYLSAAPGATVGGDFYDVLETPFGIRAILGDVRGCGLDALGGAAAVLGAFREAASYESELDTVAYRLDAALARHATAKRADGDEGPDLRAEDFATAVLLEIREGVVPEGLVLEGVLAEGAVPEAAVPEGVDGRAVSGRPVSGHSVGGPVNGHVVDARVGSGAVAGELPAATISFVSCGHPAPYLLKPGAPSAEQLDPDIPAPPLGLYALEASTAMPRVRSLPFGPGATVVLCTDGILDARDLGGSFFPMTDVLNAAVPFAPTARAVVRLVQDRLLGHTQGLLRDDAAVLVLSYVGKV